MIYSTPLYTSTSVNSETNSIFYLSIHSGAYLLFNLGGTRARDHCDCSDSLDAVSALGLHEGRAGFRVRLYPQPDRYSWSRRFQLLSQPQHKGMRRRTAYR